MHCTENLCLALAMNDRNGIRVLGNLSVAFFTLGLRCKIRCDTSFCNRCSTDAVSQNSFMEREYFAWETSKRIEEEVDVCHIQGRMTSFLRACIFLKL